MLKRDYDGQNCSIARALEVVGDRWTLLIIRDVIHGLRRFDEFLDSLGIASNVLTERLNRLVDEGVLERVPYSERPERFEYQLTNKGRELGVPLLALMQWGDRHLSDKPPRIARPNSTAKYTLVAQITEGNRTLNGQTCAPLWTSPTSSSTGIDAAAQIDDTPGRSSLSRERCFGE